MKSKYLSAAAALLCAAGLAACGGGGNGSMPLVVQVTGLDRTGLVLLNNGGDELVVTGSGTATFKTLMEPDAAFNVSVKTTPPGTECKLANNTGKINYYSYQQTVVTCTPFTYELGGEVSNLSTSGLVLANGPLTVAVPANSKHWEFATKINNMAPYGVTILSQPTGQTCSLVNATGVMPLAQKVANVNVTCQ
ncbi:hypothetical protein ABT364_22170 [Massilia sp. SR12]